MLQRKSVSNFAGQLHDISRQARIPTYLHAIVKNAKKKQWAAAFQSRRLLVVPLTMVLMNTTSGMLLKK